MLTYETVKFIHIATAIASISGFVIRGIWMMSSSKMLSNTWVKVLPHVNDTLLLITAIILVVISAQYPGSTAWLNAKIVALILYIVLGTIALRRGPTLQIRVVAWGLAVIVFIYIFVVANAKQVLLF